MKIKFLFLIFIIAIAGLTAQVKDYEIGASPFDNTYRQGGLYDYSDPGSVNMRVAVWGFVRYPGRYIVPVRTSVPDLLSLAGGPSDDANLEDIRLYRYMEDSSQVMIKINYNDLLWEDDLRSWKKTLPAVRGGDILLVPGSPRLYFRDWFSITLSLVSTLISLTILIFNIVKD